MADVVSDGGSTAGCSTRAGSGSHQPYSGAEWARLIRSCRDEVDAAFRAFCAAREQASAGDGPGASLRERTAHHWLVLHNGPDPLVSEMPDHGSFPFR